MRGTMLVFQPYHAQPARTELTAPPELEALQHAVGGWLEAVPHFDRIEIDGGEQRCVALCNEEGKLNHLDHNSRATVLWHQALRFAGLPGLILPNGGLADYLVGNVIVLFGDREFMDAL